MTTTTWPETGATLPTTQPTPTTWPNQPWSSPPCPNISPEGHACTLVAHVVSDGVRQHSAQVLQTPLYLPVGAKRRKRARFHAWVSWYTRDDAMTRASAALAGMLR